MNKLTPILKVKADELFLQWRLSSETQKQLQNDFYRIKNRESPPSSPTISTRSNANANLLGTRPASPPATPPLAFTPPGKSTLSPRRRTLSSVSQSSSQADGFSLRRNSSNSRATKQKKKGITPGCAKHLPQFFFPFGRPGDEFVDEKAKVRLIGRIFAKLTNGKANLLQFIDIVQVGVKKYHQSSLKPTISICWSCGCLLFKDTLFMSNKVLKDTFGPPISVASLHRYCISIKHSFYSFCAKPRRDNANVCFNCCLSLKIVYQLEKDFIPFVSLPF